jgi:hypothetical protein
MEARNHDIHDYSRAAASGRSYSPYRGALRATPSRAQASVYAATSTARSAAGTTRAAGVRSRVRSGAAERARDQKATSHIRMIGICLIAFVATLLAASIIRISVVNYTTATLGQTQATMTAITQAKSSAKNLELTHASLTTDSYLQTQAEALGLVVAANPEQLTAK